LVKVVATLGEIKSCTCSYTRTLHFLILRSCAYLDSLGKFVFQAKSGFKNKCRARAGFGPQNEAHLQLCASHLAKLKTLLQRHTYDPERA